MLDDEKIEKSHQILGSRQGFIRKNPIKQISFGRKVTKTSDMINGFVQFVTIGLAQLSSQQDIPKNLEIVSSRITEIPKEKISPLVPTVPYDLLWEIITSDIASQHSLKSLIIINATAECEDFPFDFFVDDEKIKYMFEIFSNGIPLSIVRKPEGQEAIQKKDINLIESNFRKMCFYIFDYIVQQDPSFREAIISERILRLLVDIRIPRSAILLLYHMLIADPPMDSKYNLEIEIIFTQILANGTIQSIMTILDIIGEDALPELDGFSLESIAETIKTRTIMSNDPTVIKKIFSIARNISLTGEEACSILIEKISTAVQLIKRGDPKTAKQQRNFAIWAITLFIEAMKEMEPEQVSAGVDFFLSLFDDAEYQIQLRIVQCFCLVDNSLITKEEIIHCICKFITSDKIGAHCLAKLNSILLTENHPLHEETLNQCVELEDDISDMLSSKNEEVSQIASLLSETIEKQT